MDKRLLIPIITVVVLGSAVGVLLIRAQKLAMRLPAESPTAYRAARAAGTDPPAAGQLVVCVGDSITHGAVSANYVELLERRADLAGFEFVNAGINGQLAYNVLRRLDDVIACDPDYVTILIGTNDVNALVSEESLNRYIEEQSLPRRPDAEWFRENLFEIGRILRENTRARIAFLSLPPIGEDATHRAYVMARQYSAIIEETASELDITYLPLHERMVDYLSSHPSNPKKTADNSRTAVVQAVFRHYVLFQSYDRISRAYGFSLLTDGLHLSGTAASMVADLIEDFLTRPRR